MNDLTVKYPNIQLSGQIDPANNRCIIDTRGQGGLYANLYCLIYGIYICLMEEITPVIQMNGSKHLYYQPEKGENVFEYYYHQDEETGFMNEPEIPTMLVICPDVFIRWCRISLSEKKTANLIINHFFKLNGELAAVINELVSRHFISRRVLGVHYRGRDKVDESRILPFEAYEKVIDNLLGKNICDMVFFCTDELHLRDYVKSKYGTTVLLYDLEADYDLHSLSEENSKTGLHFNCPTPYLQGKDAIIECYLLAQCDMLLSSSNSSFSLFSTFINPEIAHIVVNA